MLKKGGTNFNRFPFFAQQVLEVNILSQKQTFGLTTQFWNYLLQQKSAVLHCQLITPRKYA